MRVHLCVDKKVEIVSIHKLRNLCIQFGDALLKLLVTDADNLSSNQITNAAVALSNHRASESAYWSSN
jgi:hypothetical protein